LKAIITVKYKKNHSGQGRITAECPLNKGYPCTDSGGEHHSTLVFGKSLEDIKTEYKNVDIERIEVISDENIPNHRFSTFELHDEKDLMALSAIFKNHTVIRWELYSQIIQIHDNEAQIQCIAIEWKEKT